jgi:uncharacterized membrane protein
MKRLWLLLALGLLVQTPLGCGDSKDDDAEDDESVPVGNSTGATCDESLTYANDIKPIAEKYCTRCHAESVKGSARMGAPEDHNFDSEEGILDAAGHIDETAGSGPDATNTMMPPSGDKPTKAERETLAKYLACHL